MFFYNKYSIYLGDLIKKNYPYLCMFECAYAIYSKIEYVIFLKHLSFEIIQF